MGTIDARPTPTASLADVQRLAYDIYMQEGSPADRATQHWLSAESVLALGAAPGASLRVRYADSQVWIEILDTEFLAVEEAKQEQVTHALNRIVDALPRPRLVIDMHHVSLLSSAMLGTLGALAFRVRGKGGKLKLVGLSPSVRGELQVFHLDRVLDVSDGVTSPQTTSGQKRPRP